MQRGPEPVKLILSIATILLALIIGFTIPFASGGGATRKTAPWTPPPSRTVAALQLATEQPSSTPLAAGATVPSIATAAARAPRPTAPVAATTATPAPTATSTATLMPTAAAGTGLKVTIVADPLNLRAGPGTGFASLSVAKSGEVYALIGQSADGIWYQVCCVRDAPAWVNAGFVSADGAVDKVPVVP